MPFAKRTPEQVLDYFHDSYVPVPESGCWLWVRAWNSQGYGYMAGANGNRAHRYSWELHNGPIKDGLHVCHKCDTRACCNPGHLFLGTHQENMADRCRKGRTARISYPGERNGNHKLSDEDVLEIRRLYATGVAQWKLGAAYGMPQQSISRIVRRIRWSHV